MPQIEITGHVQLDKILADMPTALRNKGARKATREAAKIVADDARRLAPIDSGLLERSIKVRARKRSRRNKGTVGASVITSDQLFKGQTYYGGFVELGYKHPEDGSPQPADPFLRPALWGNQGPIKAKFRSVLKDWLRQQSVQARRLK